MTRGRPCQAFEIIRMRNRQGSFWQEPAGRPPGGSLSPENQKLGNIQFSWWEERKKTPDHRYKAELKFILAKCLLLGILSAQFNYVHGNLYCYCHAVSRRSTG